MNKKSIAEQFKAYHTQLSKILAHSTEAPLATLDYLTELANSLTTSLRDKEDAATGATVDLLPSMIKSVKLQLDESKKIAASLDENKITPIPVDYYIVRNVGRPARLYRLFDPGMAGGRFEYLSKDHKRWITSQHMMSRFIFLDRKRAQKITAEQAKQFEHGPNGPRSEEYPRLYTSGDRLYYVGEKGGSVKLFVPVAPPLNELGAWIIARTTDAKMLKRHARGKLLRWPVNYMGQAQNIRREHWAAKRKARAAKKLARPAAEQKARELALLNETNTCC